jgi:hypothetical protein
MSYGQITEPQELFYDEKGRIPIQLLTQFNSWLLETTRFINGYLVWKAELEVTSDSTPNTEFMLRHSLGRIPTKFVVVNKDKAGDVYKGSTAWTKQAIYLKCSVASVALTLEIW